MSLFKRKSLTTPPLVAQPQAKGKGKGKDEGKDDDHGNDKWSPPNHMLIAPLQRDGAGGIPSVWEVSSEGIQFKIFPIEGEYGDLGERRKVIAHKNQWAGGEMIGGPKYVDSLDEALIACWKFNFHHPWPIT